LRNAHIKAEAYHAGLSDTQRNNIQLRWIREDDCKVYYLYKIVICYQLLATFKFMFILTFRFSADKIEQFLYFVAGVHYRRC